MKLLLLLLLLFICVPSFAQTDPPELSSWMINTTGVTGYNGISANVQKVQYSTGNVYISCTGVPSFTIGPWFANPNTAQDQKYVFRIPRSPKVKTGTKTATRLGHIAVWKNGVPVYNPKDAFSYNSLNVWFQDAVLAEAISFDGCYGHPAPGGRYHTHQNPKCLYTLDSSKHSGVLGYSFDGFPIYGPFGYKNSDGTGGIARMKTSYKLRVISDRTTLAGGTTLQPNQYGPTINTTYPLGFYLEDYEFAQSYGDLDVYNGRFAKTPEYPNGIYAYHATISSTGKSEFPYIMAANYYGEVAEDNFGPGRVTINEPVSTYTPLTFVTPSTEEVATIFELNQNYPNPFNPSTTIKFGLPVESDVKLEIYNSIGQLIDELISERLSAQYYEVKWEAGKTPTGLYFYKLTAVDINNPANRISQIKKILFVK